MKCIIVGLDGAPPQHIEEWIRKGELPNLRKIHKEGIYSRLESTIPTHTCPAIPSFYTGKNPGQMGLYTFIRDDGKPISFRDIESRTFWEILGENGFKSLIFNLPLTYPPKKFNGVLVSGYPVPSPQAQFTFPPIIREQLDDMPTGIRWKDIVTGGRRDDILQLMNSILYKEFKAYLSLLHKDHFDFSLFFAKTTDVLQHYFWDDKDIILQHYKFIDEQIIGSLFEECENMMVFSDHGFEQSAKVRFNVNTWLLEKGYLQLSIGQKSRKIVENIHKSLPILLILYSFLPPSLTRIIKNCFRKEREHGKVMPGVDLERSKAYFDKYGIRVVDKQFLEEILNELKNVRYNNAIVLKGLYKKEKLFKGRYMHKIPDIVMVPNEGFTVYKSLGMITKEIFTKLTKQVKQGAHEGATEGIFMAYGKDIIKNIINKVTILDIAPTVLQMYGVLIPEDIDGTALQKILNLRIKLARRSKYAKLRTPQESISSFEKTKEKNLTKEEEKAIKEQLRDLGYL